MLKIDSVSGNEKALGEFIVQQLEGFRVEKQVVEKNRFNIIAKKGKPLVYLVVHMDTVGGKVPVRITKSRIYGRGAIDNKGNIAGAIMAAGKLENIGLIFTVGEETDLIGAKKIRVKQGSFIVMEPTKLKVMKGQRGAVAFDVIAKGIQTHSSLNFKKDASAVYNLLGALGELYAQDWTSFNAVIPDGGTKDSIVPPYAKAEIFVRPRSLEEYRKIIDYVKNAKRKNVRFMMKDSFAPCFSVSEKEIEPQEIAPFFSEMAFFKNSILFGVGDIINAHTADEFVLRKDLNRLEAELLELIGKISSISVR